MQLLFSSVFLISQMGALISGAIDEMIKYKMKKWKGRFKILVSRLLSAGLRR